MCFSMTMFRFFLHVEVFFTMTVVSCFNFLLLFWRGGEGLKGGGKGEHYLHIICILRRQCHSPESEVPFKPSLLVKQ